MARRTKEEAAATRDSILDAAEKLFVEQGVSRTTLQHIATEAGVTRGAIYWHFDDKSALFNATSICLFCAGNLLACAQISRAPLPSTY